MKPRPDITGFSKVGEVAEMFNMDGRSFSLTRMTKQLREDQYRKY